MTRTVEIRTYRLKPGTHGRFHELVTAQSIPMLQRWGTDVVSFCPSHDGGFLLVRSYESLADLHARQDAFYASKEWRDGPRQAILDLIEEHNSVELELDESIVDIMRTMFR
jgi:NIPSNAP